MPCFSLPILLIAILLALPGAATAQGSHSVPLSAFSHQIDPGAGSCDKGDTAWIALSIDAPDSLVRALTIDAFLSPNAEAWPSTVPDLDGSWLFDPGSTTHSSTWLPTPRKLTLALARNDGSAQGEGLVLRFPVRCTADSTPRTSIVAELDGIVIVDNLDLRLMTADAPDPARHAAWPNPAQGRLHVPMMLQGATWVLRDAAGQRHDAPATASGGQLQIDTSTLPAGIYLLEVSSGAARPSVQRILVR